MVEFSAGGVHGPLTELRRKGFDIGMTVGNKLVPGKNEMMTNVFTVHSAYVDSGAEGFRMVALMPILASAVSSSSAPPPLNVMPLKPFLTQFMVVSTQDIQVLHTGWPSKAPSASAMYIEHSYKGFVQGALSRAARSLIEAFSMPPLKILSKPSRLVMASASVKKGMMALVPETFKITAMTKLETGSGPVATIVSALPDGVPSLWALGRSFSDDFVAPAWAVKMLEDPESVNMEWSSMRVTFAVVTDLPQAVIRTQSTYSTVCAKTIVHAYVRKYGIVHAYNGVQYSTYSSGVRT